MPLIFEIGYPNNPGSYVKKQVQLVMPIIARVHDPNVLEFKVTNFCLNILLLDFLVKSRFHQLQQPQTITLQPPCFTPNKIVFSEMLLVKQQM